MARAGRRGAVRICVPSRSRRESGGSSVGMGTSTGECLPHRVLSRDAGRRIGGRAATPAGRLGLPARARGHRTLNRCESSTTGYPREAAGRKPARREAPLSPRRGLSHTWNRRACPGCSGPGHVSASPARGARLAPRVSDPVRPTGSPPIAPAAWRSGRSHPALAAAWARGRLSPAHPGSG
jgi:hypothetical protein